MPTRRGPRHEYPMKKYVTAVALCLTLLCSSCGVSRQATSNINQIQTEVVLAKKNYKVIGTVTGECSQTYVFGIGGLSKQSMANSAVAEMYRNANLSGSQAIINTNVSYKNKLILIYSQAKCIASGTVIEFTE